MRYLQRAFDLAEARGYLRYPEVLARQRDVPAWFLALGSDAGAADFEARHGLRVPAALQELYRCPLLAAFLEHPIDAEVFLIDLAGRVGSDMPPIVNWSAGPHLVFAFHSHSGMVGAVPFGEDDPSVLFAFEGDPALYLDEDRPPVVFSEWVFAAVNGYETQLDHWQGVFEKCRHDPAESRRLGGVEWIRGMPGMAARPDRA